MFIAPAVAGERVLIGSCSGRVFALDAGDGAVAWSFDTAADGARAQFHGEAVLDGDLLLIAGDGRPAAAVYALELGTGRVRWRQAFPGGVPVDLVRHGRAVLSVSMDGEVFALDAATGEPLWRVVDRPPGTADVRPLDPVLVGDRLVVPSPTGVVEAYRATDGERLWRRDLGGPLNTAPLALGDRVWIGGTDGRLRSFSAADGTPGPTIESSGFFYGDLVAAGGCLVALRAEGAGDGAGGLAGPHVVACFDPATGAERWRHESPEEWGAFRPLVADGSVVVGREGEVVALDAADGSPRWRLPVPGLPRGLGRDATRLFVGTLQGKALAFPWPRGAAASGPGGDDPAR